MSKFQLVENYNPADPFLKVGKHNTMEVTALPPGARVLTREQVERVLTGYFSENENVPYVLDELFGESEEV